MEPQNLYSQVMVLLVQVIVSIPFAQKGMLVALDVPPNRLERLLELAHAWSNNLGLIAGWLELSDECSPSLGGRLRVLTKLTRRGRTTLELLLAELYETLRRSVSNESVSAASLSCN